MNYTVLHNQKLANDIYIFLRVN